MRASFKVPKAALVILAPRQIGETMSGSRVAVLVAVIVLCFALFSNTQQPPTAPVGAFQLVPAEYSVTYNGSNFEQHAVFSIDSKTGQVWEYFPAGKGSDGKPREAAMIPVRQILP
jgi:hypothetical protein